MIVSAIIGVGGYIGCIGVVGCWWTLAVLGCIGGFSSCCSGHIDGVSVYRRHLQGSEVGGDRRWASMVVAAIVGVGGYIIVSASAVVGDRRRLWAALAGSAVVGGRIGGAIFIGGICSSRRYYSTSARESGHHKLAAGSWVILVYWRVLGVALTVL